MTAKRDLKRRVRARQARTGESYTTALRHVRSQRSPDAEAVDAEAVNTEAVDAPATGSSVPVVEVIDISDIGAAIGIKCAVKLSPRLVDRIDAASVLQQLRGVLTATARDPAFDLMRAVLLHGEQPVRGRIAAEASLRFMLRARAGVGGLSDHGRHLAITVEGRRGPEMIVFLLWLPSRSYSRFPPALYVASSGGMTADSDDFVLLWR